MPTVPRRRLTILVGLTLALGSATAATAASPAHVPTVGPIVTVSTACSSSQNAEAQQALDPAIGYVYEDWMGCQGIGFARSRDGGRTFDPAISLPGTSGSSKSATWDPAIAVGPDGAVYTVFIVSKGSGYYPVAAKSTDHGATFPQVTSLLPPDQKNWGDRPFIAVDPSNASKVYVSWDYGPSRASIDYICATGGSCAFKSGDLNVVMQRSTDGGLTFGPIVPINPGYPAGGGDSAPMVIEPSGRVDVLFQDYQVLDPVTYALGPAIERFTSSTDGGAHWSAPVPVGASAGTMSLAEWWINGSIATDAAGNLYATWDTQGSSTDIGWLSYSTNNGATWSAPIRATPDVDNAPHITQVTGGAAGLAYVGVLSNASPQGYALTLRPFQIPSGSSGGWLSNPSQISIQYGDPAVWPGDTFGLSTMSAGHIVASWGSGIPTSGKDKSQIFETVVGY